MASFKSYNPIGTYARACEACYARKGMRSPPPSLETGNVPDSDTYMRCDISGSSGSCSNCSNHGFACKSRSRRRKDQNRQPSLPGRRSKTLHHDHISVPSPVERQASQQRSWNTIALSPTQPRAETVVPGQTSAPLLFVHHSVKAANPTALVGAVASPRVDEFYNSSYLSRRAVLGDEFPDIDHSHGSHQPHEHTLTESDMKVLELYNAFELPPIPVRQTLFEIFYERCFTWMPVVDEKTVSADSSRGATSLLVLQAVLLTAASTKPERDPMLPSYQQYRRVKAIVDTCAERNPLNLLAALCLMQFYAPAAPKDISTDHPRFWGTYALGLALQMGLNMKTTKRGSQEGLKRRVWWTLYARDSMMSSAHGRARIVNPADCDIEPPSIYDFPDPSDLRAQIFVSYVSITSILSDLCQMLTRRNDPPMAEKNKVGLRLLDYVRTLPPALRLVQPNGVSRPYSFDLAQLHIHLLTTIIILYRPQSIFCVPPASAPAIVASNLNFRIFEAMELRGHTCFVSSGCAWHLLVTAIPQLSCLGIPALREECKSNLDALEGVFRTLGSTRPSARNNLRNIRVIRKALESKDTLPMPRHDVNLAADAFSFSPLDLFDPYGVEVPGSYDRIAAALESASNESFRSSQNTGAMQERHQSVLHMPGAEAHSFVPTLNNFGAEGVLDDFPELLGSNFPEDGWMRNWINELNLFGE